MIRTRARTTLTAAALLILPVAGGHVPDEPGDAELDGAPGGGVEGLRRRWEYSHAVVAVLYAIALTSLVLSVLSARR